MRGSGVGTGKGRCERKWGRERLIRGNCGWGGKVEEGVVKGESDGG